MWMSLVMLLTYRGLCREQLKETRVGAKKKVDPKTSFLPTRLTVASHNFKLNESWSCSSIILFCNTGKKNRDVLEQTWARLLRFRLFRVQHHRCAVAQMMKHFTLKHRFWSSIPSSCYIDRFPSNRPSTIRLRWKPDRPFHNFGASNFVTRRSRTK